MLSFRLFELGSGSEAAAAVLQVERGLGFEEFRAKCMASIGCRIVHCECASWSLPCGVVFGACLREIEWR